MKDVEPKTTVTPEELSKILRKPIDEVTAVLKSVRLWRKQNPGKEFSKLDALSLGLKMRKLKDIEV